MADFRIDADRLTLREWCEDDAAAMHAMGQDARVMELLGPPTSLDQARALVAGQIVNQRLFGHCFWPIERRADGAMIGFCGLQPGPEATPLEGSIEIGWRLRHDAWGRGYAREAAGAALAWGWAHLAVPAIAAITVPANTRSRGLMERLGMRRHPEEDFDHPGSAPGDPLRAYVVYRIGRPGR